MHMDISEVLKAIEAKRGQEVRLHPYGFLQLSLSDTGWRDAGYRLHVWSEELPPMKMPEFKVHDHIYSVKSTVLLGKLKDTRYSVIPDMNGDYVVFEATQGKLVNTAVRVYCDETSVLYIEKGEEYFIPKGDFHSSKSLAPLTATLFQKVDAEPQRSPKVIGPRMYETINVLSDDREFDQNFAWNIIQKAVDGIKTQNTS